MASNTPQIKNFKTEVPGGLSEDQTKWLFPEIKSTTKLNQTNHWLIFVAVIDKNTNKFAKIRPNFFDRNQLPQNLAGWYKVEGKINDGKIRDTTPTFVLSGKNIGRKNETNVFTQALRDALGIYNKQLKKSSVLTTQNNLILYPPMLAESNISIIEFPAYIQRKYNGVRAIAVKDSDVLLYSRQRNLYPALQYIKADLSKVLTKGLYLDGELYKHGMSLQEISGFVRNESSVTGNVEYLIYDCFIPAQPNLVFTERYDLLKNLNIQGVLKLAEVYKAETYKDIDVLYDQFLAEGFEGAMIRFDRPYEYSHNKRRSKFLMKRKPINDHEYIISGFNVGKKGKAAGALMIICKTEDGINFPVTPAMEIVERKTLAAKMQEIDKNGRTHFENCWLGKPLIVYFAEVSEDGLPLQARTKMELRLHD